MSYSYDPDRPVGTQGGALTIPGHEPGPVNQANVEDRDDVVSFTSDILPDDLEVTAPVRAVLTAKTAGESVDWVVRLCDVDEHGVSRNTEPSGAGSFDIYLWATSMVFKAGHRIRVQITSSNFPRWDRTRQSQPRQTRSFSWREGAVQNHPPNSENTLAPLVGLQGSSATFVNLPVLGVLHKSQNE